MVIFRSPVGFQLILHIFDDMFNNMLLVIVEMQQSHGWLIAFHQFGSCKAQGKPGFCRLVHNNMGDGVDGFVNLAFTEIVFPGLLVFRGNADGNIYQFVTSFVFPCRNGNNGNAQFFREFCHIDGVAAGTNFVHHIQGDDHWNAQFDKLKGEIEVPFDIGGIHDIDDAVWVFIQDKIPGDNLF